MLVKEAQQLIDWIYRERYSPERIEGATIAEAREQIRQGAINPDTGKKLQEIYKKAAFGGGHQRRQFIGGSPR